MAYQAADASRDLMDWLSQPIKVVANQFVDVPYTTPLTNVDEYLSRATLQIDKDIVTIDGVDYTDVWLSNDAAEIFRVNAFDIENAFDITSQSEGTFVSGAGKLDGIPMFSNGTEYFSQKLNRLNFNDPPAAIGIYEIQGTYTGNKPFYPNFTLTRAGTYYERGGQQQSNSDEWNFQLITTPQRPNNPTARFSYLNKFDSNTDVNVSYFGDFVAEPFYFDWVAGTIPADEPLETDQGLRIRVPTEEVENWYTEYPDTGDSVVISMGDPELTAKIDDLIDTLIPIIPILDIDFTQKETPTPAPDPEPVPDPAPYPDPLPDPSISLIDSTLKDIVQALKNIYDSIAIGNTFSEAIKNLNDKINWSLDEIKEQIGDLADRIERGSADWFRDIVSSIWQPFLPILNIFRAGVGIWHYVVEWLQYIHAPFVTFWNFLGSAGYIFVSPIYAAAAAAIVIAIYRRFGR